MVINYGACGMRASDREAPARPAARPRVLAAVIKFIFTKIWDHGRDLLIAIVSGKLYYLSTLQSIIYFIKIMFLR